MKVTLLKTTKHKGKYYTGGHSYDLLDKDAKALIDDGRAVKFGEAPPRADPNRLELRPEQGAKLERDTETTEEHDKDEDFQGDTRHQQADVSDDEEEVEEDVEEEDPTTKERRSVKKKVRRKRSRG